MTTFQGSSSSIRLFAAATEEDKKLIWKMAEKMQLDRKPE